MALALGAVGTMVVLGLPSPPEPHARAPLCEPEDEPAVVSSVKDVPVGAADPEPGEARTGEVWDGVAALTLRLPRLGTTKARVLAETPQCASDWDDEQRGCRFHGSVGPLPLSETCEDGCTWWTYRFGDDDRLTSVELRRSVADVDDTFVAEFVDEAAWISTALERALGPSSPPESLETWAEVESPTVEHDEPIVLQRRTWVRAEGTTVWQVVGVPGHHPVVELHVTMTAPE